MIAVLAVGGRPDPPALRAAAQLLGDSWRFHIGDDPQWAQAEADDSGWETVDLSAPASSHDGDVGLPNYVGGWMAHGHPGYQGYASLPAYLWLTKVLWMPLSLAAWTLAWNRWRLRSPRAIDGATLALAVVGIAGGAMHVMAMTRICRLGLLALLVAPAGCVVIQRYTPYRTGLTWAARLSVNGTMHEAHPSASPTSRMPPHG